MPTNRFYPSQTGIEGDKRRTMLFDTGPEEDVWERNVKRLRPDLSSIELIHLSHWHRDHSGNTLIWTGPGCTG